MINIHRKKKDLLNLIKILSNNKVIYLFDMSKLTCNHISIIKKRLYKYNINMKMIKNTLLEKSIKNIKNKNIKLFSNVLKGNTSIIFSNKSVENIIPKIIKKFRVEENIKNPILKVAYVQDSLYFDDINLDILLNIKSKEELIYELLKTIKTPVNKILLSISKNKIYEILKSLAIKK